MKKTLTTVPPRDTVITTKNVLIKKHIGEPAFNFTYKYTVYFYNNKYLVQ